MPSVKFYQQDFAGAARIINNLRNETSLKKFLFTDVEYKLFQAMVLLQGEDGCATSSSRA